MEVEIMCDHYIKCTTNSQNLASIMFDPIIQQKKKLSFTLPMLM